MVLLLSGRPEVQILLATLKTSPKTLIFRNVINLRKETIPDTFISLPGIKVSGIVLEINFDISCYSIVFIR